ncbi:LCP family protein [Allostreptomyces psammosilenae]|uniref:LCP family protein required for cell wall assembly n=1 Tax=Allostreptomyces psammosilenae TaxID=1892865 RepID=A0A852ZZM7_9ACTN|nr:LCP family protein [Allostreptomyces psammosilenae]NYI06144.1 LCP family protein required for cell wall assembly [Allostreptomyces psammosilenae]
MDAQYGRTPGGRSGSDDIDPADQWVFDPATGSYTLRPPVEQGPPGDAAAPPPAGTVPRQSPAPSDSVVPDNRSEGLREGAPRARSRARAAGTSATAGAAATATPAAASPTDTPGGTADIPRPGGRAAARAAARGRGPAGATTTGSGTANGPGGGGRAARRKAGRPKRRRRALSWTAGAAGFVLVAVAGTAFAVYQRFSGNITGVEVNLGDGRPAAAGDGGPLNILVIGTDTREGQDGDYGDAGSVGHADTTFLFHVSADRSNATAISFPRDLMVEIPECQTGDQVIPGETLAMFNTSLGQNGRDPGCTWKTVEQLTGVRIDHFIMVDFDAVKTLSTAIGGVEVCVSRDINDPKSHLNLTAGTHVLQGEEALAFVRTRYAVGNGGDLSRIPLQQQFLSSMIRKIQSSDTLTDPTKLWNLADAATKSLTVDEPIASINALSDLALDIASVDTKNITFATVPVVDYEPDPNRLALKQPDAGQLFAMIRDDASLTETEAEPADGSASAEPSTQASGEGAPEESASPEATATESAVEEVPAAEVRVSIQNGSDTIGAAQETVSWLQNEKGFLLSSNGGNADPTAKSTLVYSPEQEGAARTFAEAMGLPDSALDDSGTGEEMVFTIGDDFLGAGVPMTTPTVAPSGLQSVQADDEDVCAG